MWALFEILMLIALKNYFCRLLKYTDSIIINIIRSTSIFIILIIIFDLIKTYLSIII